MLWERTEKKRGFFKKIRPTELLFCNVAFAMRIICSQLIFLTMSLKFLPQSTYCDIRILANRADDTRTREGSCTGISGDHHHADFPRAGSLREGQFCRYSTESSGLNGTMALYVYVSLRKCPFPVPEKQPNQQTCQRDLPGEKPPGSKLKSTAFPRTSLC